MWTFPLLLKRHIGQLNLGTKGYTVVSPQLFQNGSKTGTALLQVQFWIRSGLVPY